MCTINDGDPRFADDVDIGVSCKERMLCKWAYADSLALTFLELPSAHVPNYFHDSDADTLPLRKQHNTIHSYTAPLRMADPIANSPATPFRPPEPSQRRIQRSIIR